MIPDNLITDARAKIIWGDDPVSVRYFLTSNGVSPAEADEQIAELLRERNAEVRKIGIRNILLGFGLIGLGGAFFWLVFSGHRSPNVGYRAGRGYAVVALLVLYGIWKLVDGMVRLIKPKSEHGSISDI